MLDVIVIGYGPGAQQLIVRLKEQMDAVGQDFKYKIIEKNSLPGSFFYKFPTHKKLISNNKLYTGHPAESKFSERFDWNSIVTKEKKILARNYSSDFYPNRSLVYDMMRDVHDEYGICVNFNEECKKIVSENGTFKVITNKDEYFSKVVVVATGYKPYMPDKILGIEIATPYEKMKNSSYYRDKSVFIIGKGNSGLECAKDIMNEANMILLGSPSSIKFAYQSHYVGNPRITNCVPIENYQLKSMSAMLDCKIQKIEKCKTGAINVYVKYMHANEEEEVITVDEVICATGFKPNLPSVEPEISKFANGYPEIDGNFCSRHIDNLYFAGAITHGLDYKKHSSSGFIHGFRYNSMALADLLCEKVFSISVSENIKENSIKDIIFEIINNDAGIYLQPGFLGVSLLYKEGKMLNCGYQTIEAFKELEVKDGIKLLLTLEYGNINDFSDVLSIPRNPGEPEASAHIHPVIRIKGISKTDEVILEENLFNNFKISKKNQAIIEELEKLIVSCN